MTPRSTRSRGIRIPEPSINRCPSRKEVCDDGTGHEGLYITDAPVASGQVSGKGFGETNLDVHYAFPSHLTASLGIYNLLNVHVAAAGHTRTAAPTFTNIR
jgi:hypothetical protein